MVHQKKKKEKDSEQTKATAIGRKVILETYNRQLSSRLASEVEI